MKKIAVITPVFNAEKFIGDCMRSVALSTTSSNLFIEHIVADAYSTDNSWNIIQDIKLPHLRSLRLEKNYGPSEARNLAIKQTDADFLFCLDADDVIFQNSLKSLFEYIEMQKSDWIYGDFLRTNENLSYLLGQDYYGYQFENSGDLLTSMFSGKHFFQQNCFYRKQIFDSVGGFDNQIEVGEDFDLFIRFALEGHLPKYLPAPLYIHRLHEHNLSKIYGRENNPEVYKKDIKTLHEKYKKDLESILTPQQLEEIKNFLQ